MCKACKIWENCETSLKGPFKDKEELIHVVDTYHVKLFCSFEVTQSTPTRYEIACHAEIKEKAKCDFRLHAFASEEGASFNVTLLRAEHTCPPNSHLKHLPVDRQRWLEKSMKDMLRADPKLSTKQLRNLIQEE